jgi:hypothetical protein
MLKKRRRAADLSVRRRMLMGAGMLGTLVLIYASCTALSVAAAVSVVRKAGYSGWWVLAGLVPLVNIVTLFAFAFADWPVLRELRELRRSPSNAGGPKSHPNFAAQVVLPRGGSQSW